jgi:hypothetical protein
MTFPSPGDPFWREAVMEGKAIVAKIDDDWWRLAELADRITTKYGEKTLSKYAAEIGAVACTLERRLSTYRRWNEIPAAPPESYAVAQALQAHPNRAEIIQANPNITTAEARDKMREWRGGGEVEVHQDQDWKRWFAKLVVAAQDIVAEVNISAMTPESRRILLSAVEPKLLPTLRDAGEALIQLADKLDQIDANERDFAAAE